MNNEYIIDNNNNKFCCIKFSFLNSGDKTMGINIRIIKLSNRFVERAQLDFNVNFLITEGYENLDTCKKIVISYCPFCGTELNTFYLDEKYIQEEIDI